ncbi:(2Fe-2S) ferredoxin domain-containing protein [Alicyclobacillus tolerans]|uniref:Cobaltochelatase CobN n=1 Tax=Alicyclobacillus tolerans TaxID=90970 RepID=A0ABT9LS56_9BACL|nr:(2Fe-2S) ferredoxin domain-containing protein [Alicyclobacillus tengchongensis]MDP9727104.1 cobaltochelatase CobN [Alicyclobacillus tengchongensis]
MLSGGKIKGEEWVVLREEQLEVWVRPTTKRLILAQVFVCSGCCCGRTDKGKPSIPLDWLKKTWKERKLLKTVQLTITGCLGPCDVLNVVSIWTPDRQFWFGNITTDDPYEELLAWAEMTRELGQPAPIPDALLMYQFERF